MYSSTYTLSLNDANAFASDEWRIDMKDAWLVLWWCRQLNLTKSQLEHAVHAAGDSIVDVKQYLANQQPASKAMPVQRTSR